MAEQSCEGQMLHLQEVTEFQHQLHHFSSRNRKLSRHKNGNREGQLHTADEGRRGVCDCTTAGT